MTAKSRAQALTVVVSMLLVGCPPAPQASPAGTTVPDITSDAVHSEERQEPLTVFLVRHGEKVDQSADAALSDAGHERSAALARSLRSAGIDVVLSSDFARTRETAQPLATLRGLDLTLYDHQDLPGLARRLRVTGGRQLVVGHSNTTPALVELLGGDPGPPIDEAEEYDRLYIVTLGSDGQVHSVLLRYGE